MSEDRQPAASGQQLPWTPTGEPTQPSADARLPGRRAFLVGTGGLAAAAPWSCASPPPTSNSVTRFPQPRANGDEDATASLGRPPSPRPCPTTPWARSTRQRTGRCCGPSAAAAQTTSRGSRWAAASSWPTPRAPSRSSSRAPDPWQRPLKPPPTLNSEAFAGEMTECYWLALARDIPYARYGQEPITTAAIADLRRFADHQGLDAHTLFRSIHPPRPARSPSAPPTSSTRSPARPMPR
jgi:hypothetical protein